MQEEEEGTTTCNLANLIDGLEESIELDVPVVPMEVQLDSVSTGFMDKDPAVTAFEAVQDILGECTKTFML